MQILKKSIHIMHLHLLTINKKCIKNTNTVSYEIKYVSVHQNSDGRVPLCLRFTDADAYLIEGNENKYLVFVWTKNNKEEVLEPY